MKTNWATVKLGDICEYVNEKIPLSKIDNLNYISTDNMLQNKQGVKRAISLPKTKYICSFTKNDILVSNIRPYFQKIWFAKNNGGCSNDILVFRGKKDVSEKFLYYLLANDNFFSYTTATSKGTKMPRGDKVAIMQYLLQLPPLETQKKIADILSAFDDKIELNNKINKNLEEQAQALFKHWFVDFEFPNENGAPYKSSGGIMIDSELGKIPEGWRVGTLGEISEIIMGQSPSGTSYNREKKGIVFYQGRGEFGDFFPTRRLYTTEPKRMAAKTDILLSVRAPVGDYNIATEKCCIGRGLAAIHPKENFYSYTVLLMEFLQPIFNKYNGEGTVFGSINKDALFKIKIIIPTIKTVSLHEKNSRNHLIKMLNSFKQNQKLATMRDTLLPKLLNGEIAV
ncbi:MAG: restriction endonuclease subunit S [Treponemataceae bacterium]